jgi:hypothetical protein
VDLSLTRGRTPRRVKFRRLACGLVAAVLASGCGAARTVAPEFESGGEGTRITNARHGYSVALPAGWHRAGRNLTPQLMDPREILSVATYPLRYTRRARCRIPGCPTPALNGFRATDILMSIQERLHARTTAKDVAIDLGRRQTVRGGTGNCTRGRVAWYAFEAFAEAGRSLYVLVVMGERAPARSRADLKRLLVSLRFSPRGGAASSKRSSSRSQRLSVRSGAGARASSTSTAGQSPA